MGSSSIPCGHLVLKLLVGLLELLGFHLKASKGCSGFFQELPRHVGKVEVVVKGSQQAVTVIGVELVEVRSDGNRYGVGSELGRTRSVDVRGCGCYSLRIVN